MYKGRVWLRGCEGRVAAAGWVASSFMQGLGVAGLSVTCIYYDSLCIERFAGWSFPRKCHAARDRSHVCQLNRRGARTARRSSRASSSVCNQRTTHAPETMSAMATTGSTTTSAVRSYVYTSEIGRMAFVLGQVTEADDNPVKHIEELVRTQLIEIVSSSFTPPCHLTALTAPSALQVLQARTQAIRRGSRQLSVEDLLFLIRHDTPKVTRLKAYLSSKSAHQKPRESEELDDERELEQLAIQIEQQGAGESLPLPWSR